MSECAFVERLSQLGVPKGLASQLAIDDQRIGKRIYLLDNSGSMAECDGSELADVGGGQMRMASCTRWEECVAFAKDHARWNLACGTPCEFMLLNTMRAAGVPPQEGVDFICLHDDKADFGQLEGWLRKATPRGVTPLSIRLQEIRARIQEEAHELAAAGQMVFLTIATDGLPTSAESGQSLPADRNEFGRQLRQLCNDFPVQLVIRLCTNDETVTDFYSQLDGELELPMDVLDDIRGEAEELRKLGNDWFAYSPLLHRIREAGTLCKLFDNLDERKLSRGEARRLA